MKDPATNARVYLHMAYLGRRFHSRPVFSVKLVQSPVALLTVYDNVPNGNTVNNKSVHYRKPSAKRQEDCTSIYEVHDCISCRFANGLRSCTDLLFYFEWQ